jgi:type VI secretion system protein ImpM
MDQYSSRTGFFGKVVTHGDFVSRRLSPTFVRQWDDWLQAGLRHSRERLGMGWQAVYLCSPVWHFALASGVCGEPAWAGVLMPSVDRVGRYFPLTVAYGGPDVSPVQRLCEDTGWYADVERLALSSLAEGFSLELFDAALTHLPAPSRRRPLTAPAESGTPAAEASWRELREVEDLAEAIARWSIDLGGLTQRKSLARHALFWTEGSSHLPPTRVLSHGLPSAQTFADMLAGRQVSTV